MQETLPLEGQAQFRGVCQPPVRSLAILKGITPLSAVSYELA